MKRLLPFVLLLCLCTSASGIYPYDSVCEIVTEGSGAAGSAVLIATSDKLALLLTVRHVVDRKGNTILVHWAATGEKSVGTVLLVGGGDTDIAMCLCPKPDGLIPVPVKMPDIRYSGPITNVGYPGVEGSLEWQVGNITGLSRGILNYDCRPIPGMSGGATFDRFGNLVGLIQYFRRYGGGSTSGVEMMDFLHLFLSVSPAQWEVKEVSYKKPIPEGDPEKEIWSIDKWDEYCDYILEKYGIRTNQPTEQKLEPAPVFEPPPDRCRNRYKRQRLRIRLFNRRI